MVSVLTWLTDKTDNINLVIEVAVGIVVTASVTGARSKQKIQQWLLSPESDPYVRRTSAKLLKASLSPRWRISSEPFQNLLTFPTNWP